MKSIPTFTLAFAFAIAHKLYSNYVFKLSPYVVTAFAVMLPVSLNDHLGFTHMKRIKSPEVII